MNLNIQINNEVYKQQPVKSPRNHTPQNHEKYKSKDKNIQINEYKTFIRAYRKEVQLPINFQTSIFMSKTPQRCLQHNYTISLFCLTDKKPLCIHCMPQLISHKRQSVVPLNKLNQKLLKQQLKIYIKNINTNIFPIMAHLIQKNTQNIQKIQNQISAILQKINNFYNQLILLLKNSKQQYLKQYMHFNENLKTCYSNFGNQISKIKQYTQEKLKQLTDKIVMDENILYHHNMAMHLNKLGLILTPEFCQYKSKAFEIDLKLQKTLKQIKKLLIQDKTQLQRSYSKAKLQRKSSLSPKATKNNFNPIKKQQNYQTSLSKIRFNPRINSGITQRQQPKKKQLQQPKKKQFYFNIFNKNKRQKEDNHKSPKNYRKSQTHYVFQK